MESSKRVIFNTGILYARMIITVGVSLYTTRLFLIALGSLDYGIYNLIAGVIAMLSFLNAAMATSTQRYLSFYENKKNRRLIQKVFANSLTVHIVIALLIFLLLQCASRFIFGGYLSIPPDRIESAAIAYQFAAFGLFASIASVPFLAILHAKENMVAVALISILEISLKLLAAYYLINSHYDRLIVFGCLLAAINVVIALVYLFYTAVRYSEVNFRCLVFFNKRILGKLTSFAGWNLFGTLCVLGRTQGLAVILNVFFGAVTNAAFGIANQVAWQLTFFSISLLQALNPQIIKSEAEGNRSRMLKLAMVASKSGFFFVAFIGIPFIFEMPGILATWLHQVPEHTVIFCNLLIIGTLVNQLTIGLQSAAQAVGEIKYYQIAIGSLLLLNVPIAYILLKWGFPAYSILGSYILIEFLACVGRIAFLRKLAQLSFRVYFMRVLRREILPTICSVLICLLMVSYVELPFRFVYTCSISILFFLITIYFLGLCQDEREYLNTMIFKYRRKYSTRLIET